MYLCMKKILILTGVIGLLLAACYPTTKITGSWKNTKQADKKYGNIFIAALTANNIARNTIETQMEKALNTANVKTLKSLDEFPPNFHKDSISKKDVMRMVQKKGNEAILTITILKKETESRYVSGGYAPAARFGYYGSFWGYYNYWYPYTYSDAYYSRDAVYYLETNLYDSETQDLMWSAQSETYDYEGFEDFSKQYAKVIVDKMKKDGVLKVSAATGVVGK